MVENFPTIVIGTTDSKRSFVLGGVAICSSEQEEDYEFVFRSLTEYYKKTRIDFSFRFVMVALLFLDWNYNFCFFQFP